ncbi:unnamed protein product [Didymodactylos carnosus]|uniref:Aspartate aminotransferase n=1 Tax=Didymodactylos carnosus TaxID=1234261 RepID=A0A814DZ60_9BILA|nr:unnamed protein product [Didymodactylos carnosus]CAF0964974.1 unnamed protein product [Didymodactylos carnosus]CAF3736854.1 unnamed protein product [Didymodactylos carnosus]CAF3736956.1 unnamed protein product [Didymodactylos carnosus]
MGRFDSISTDPPIDVFHLTELFENDGNPSKVNLGVGVFQDENGKTPTLPVVRSVEQSMAQDLTLDKNYLKSVGLDSFCQACLKLVLGEQSSSIIENRACSIQGLSGTGCLTIGLEFLYRNGYKIGYISSPTWSNHLSIMQAIGFDVKRYRYWNKEKLNLDIDGLLQDLQDAPENSVILLHACAHNPTGCDPTREQWQQISDVIKQRKLFPFFDFAYQGFSTGDLDQDAWPIRYFADHQKHELLVAQSFSKNFSLYNERVGHLTGVFSSRDIIPKFRSQLTTIIRRIYSNPPAHGAHIVATILCNPTLYSEWKNNVRTMFERIQSMRQLFYTKLKQLGTPGNWDHIITQHGMIAFTGLNPRQCQTLLQQHHIYLMSDGRINICAITQKNIDQISKSFYEVITTVADDPKL